MELKIAVIDDERPARSELMHQLLVIFPDADIQEGDSGAAALQLAGKEKFDLFFLDINLGDINGTILIDALKNMQPGMKIIFVTAYSEYAVTAFELGVQDYVLKPFDKARLLKVVERCMGQTEAKKEKAILKKLAISSEGKTVYEDVDDIIYIETQGRGCVIHVDKKQYYEGKSIGKYEKKLEGLPFFRCHKSYLINLTKVKELFPWENNSLGLKMQGSGQQVLPVAREKSKILRQLLEG